MSDQLQTRVEDRVAQIIFNRPETRNGLVPQFLGEVMEAVKAFEADPGVRVILFTGNGPDFSSGGDKGFLREVQKMTPDEVQKNVYSFFQGAVRLIKLCSKPTVAVVNGAAVGTGCDLALATDFRVVSKKSFFHENWTAIGCIPPLGAMYLLPRLIGLERAANMVMRAQRVYGEEAVRIGLATHLAQDDAQLRDEGQAFAKDLACRSADALRAAKVALRRSMEGTLAGEWEFNLLQQGRLLSGPDFASALDAIEAKRAPTY
ncbi:MULTISPECIES: enoyl-CoA hydratase/isomerase family protein [unclassified Variovorax]|uniref:enoyl-CoA hydratase/isomerase family protein n=1 Tax=unclassified Variovorax TaxID=663243 RepID=UPI001316BC00|nr:MULTISPECIES: enoyl-CoA hydratase/isomerase family protein [unclassified Variovorax]VTU29810.1 putative enoyl-CoA hydratase echA8 [Variovorax sp. SRS16]VTU37495.1 putative enoyl-CoA hydratase echA8 [Variovorax sp. PBL-E5]